MAGVPVFNKEIRSIIGAVSDGYNAATNATGKIAFTLPKGALVDPNGWANVGYTGAAFDAGTAKIGNNAGVTASANDDSLWASADLAPTTQALKLQVLATVNVAPHLVPLIEDLDYAWTVATAATGGIMIVQPFFYPYKFPSLL